jgi:hypothetical protein
MQAVSAGGQSRRAIGGQRVVVPVISDVAASNPPAGTPARAAISADHWHRIAILRKMLSCVLNSHEFLQPDLQSNVRMADFKHTYWGRQLDNLAQELSKLAIACDIELGKPGLAERILNNDETVCGRKNPIAFKKMRQHLMALFNVEKGAVERLGPEDTKEILDQVRAAIVEIRQAGSPSHSLPREQP